VCAHGEAIQAYNRKDKSTFVSPSKAGRIESLYFVLPRNLPGLIC
jgi:hypothetical protein